jgi:hypothetical protein
MSLASIINFRGGLFSWDSISLAAWVLRKRRIVSELFTPWMLSSGVKWPLWLVLEEPCHWRINRYFFSLTPAHLSWSSGVVCWKQSSIVTAKTFLCIHWYLYFFSLSSGASEVTMLTGGKTPPFFFFFFSRNRVFLYSSGCPAIHFVDQAGLELRNLPASASQVLGLASLSTFPALFTVFH